MISLEDGDKTKEVKADRNVAFGDLVQGIVLARADLAAQYAVLGGWARTGNIWNN